MEKYLKLKDCIISISKISSINLIECNIVYWVNGVITELKEFQTKKSARFIFDSIADFLDSDERVFSNFELPVFKEGDVFHFCDDDVATVVAVFNRDNEYHYDFSDDITRCEDYLLDKMAKKECEVVEKLLS